MRTPLLLTTASFSLILVASAMTFSCDGGTSSNDGGDVPDTVQPPNDGGGEAGDSAINDGGGEGGDPNCTVAKCAKEIALGLEHACALGQDGVVRCWGLNSFGQLGVGPGGVGDAGAADSRNLPVQVMGIGPAKAISAGFNHTCALLSDDSVWCWGDNSRGQLGQAADGGAQPPKPMPVKINGTPANITQIQASGFHTCVLAGGAVSCWGLNTSGQIGTGTIVAEAGVTPGIVTTPTAVANLTGVTDLGLGDQFTCASTASNVQCFGSNSFGQLARGGDAGVPSYSPTPGAAQMLGMGADLARSAGSHQCAIEGSGGKCWGRNHVGQVTGTPDVPVTTPGAVMGLMMPKEIAPGNTHTCALLSGGTVQCWGGNRNGQSGQMGAGDPEAGVAMPTNVSGVTDALTVASGWGDFSCAVTKGGAVWCWGANYHGQLGRGGNAPPYDSTAKRVTFP